LRELRQEKDAEIQELKTRVIELKELVSKLGATRAQLPQKSAISP